MNRQQRQKLAQETVDILDAGFYSLFAGTRISIGQELQKACAETLLYLPDDYQELCEKIATKAAGRATTIVVSNRTTLEASQALLSQFQRVLALNFASAKNPGGGFLSGSQAQEESLARSSGLYATLQTKPEFYDFHRRQTSCFYSDRVIYSPNVPVFRSDDGNLLATPWNVSFLTSAAVNAGAVRRNEPALTGSIFAVMQQRARMVLAVSAAHEYEALVLGAWGCGVFANNPADIAHIFATVLAEPEFKGCFSHIEFAVYDPLPEQSTYRAFKNELTL